MSNKRAIPAELITTIIARYNNGESTSSIARDQGCSADTIANTLRREGVTIRGRSERRQFTEKECRHPDCRVRFKPTGSCHFYCPAHDETSHVRTYERSAQRWAEIKEALTHPCPVCGEPVEGRRQAHPGRCTRLYEGNKTCWKCHEKKDLEDFHSDESRGDGLDPICRDCHNNSSKTQRLIMRESILQRYGGACRHCGELDPDLLEIDHINGGGRQERQAIRSPYTYAKKVLEDTTGAYQLLCANCHTKKTRKEGALGGTGRPRKALYETALLHRLELRKKDEF